MVNTFWIVPIKFLLPFSAQRLPHPSVYIRVLFLFIAYFVRAYKIANSTNLLCKSVCRCSVFLLPSMCVQTVQCTLFLWLFDTRIASHRMYVSFVFVYFIRFMAIVVRRNEYTQNAFNEESIFLFAFSALRYTLISGTKKTEGERESKMEKKQATGQTLLRYSNKMATWVHATSEMYHQPKHMLLLSIWCAVGLRFLLACTKFTVWLKFRCCSSHLF